ncbi:fatty acid desaturase [Paenibacillus lupini]|uniref:fatty acid desaturase n=1 Tax=Paenibacillus lupini TaxID=1450204 RepID=UPI0014201EC0|nr:fatty acid desaturase [Paenibacillus lupini]NIK24380.1 omega-6 fatty acid desaturase (delta-12 desaturase) [Paenibacillus lupini]
MQNSVRQLKKDMAPYEKSNPKTSILQILNTILPFVVLWYVAYLSLSVSYLLTLAVAVVASGFVVRTFIIFHDCCHQSMFKSKRLNEIVGTFTGILTFFPYYQWKHAHSIHHATSSNLNKRGIGDIWILTVDEYLTSSVWKRIGYRLYRNPFVLFVLGPFYTILIENRFNRKNAKAKERINLYLTNLGIVVVAGLVCWAIGWQAFLMVQIPIFYVSGAAGIWLFYVQHQFEDSYFENEEEWDYVKAAVEGSSYYKLPKLLQWLSGNIGFHHVHHLSPRVPNYYLEEAHNMTPALHKVTTITIASSLQAIRFRLWDESNKRFVGFKEISERVKKSKMGAVAAGKEN